MQRFMSLDNCRIVINVNSGVKNIIDTLAQTAQVYLTTNTCDLDTKLDEQAREKLSKSSILEENVRDYFVYMQAEDKRISYLGS